MMKPVFSEVLIAAVYEVWLGGGRFRETRPQPLCFLGTIPRVASEGLLNLAQVWDLI